MALVAIGRAHTPLMLVMTAKDGVRRTLSRGRRRRRCRACEPMNAPQDRQARPVQRPNPSSHCQPPQLTCYKHVSPAHQTALATRELPSPPLQQIVRLRLKGNSNAQAVILSDSCTSTLLRLVRHLIASMPMSNLQSVASSPQEKEELAKLRLRADDLVNKAYFRYAGAPDARSRPSLQNLAVTQSSIPYCLLACLPLASHAEQQQPPASSPVLSRICQGLGRISRLVSLAYTMPDVRNMVSRSICGVAGCWRFECCHGSGRRCLARLPRV